MAVKPLKNSRAIFIGVGGLLFVAGALFLILSAQKPDDTDDTDDTKDAKKTEIFLSGEQIAQETLRFVNGRSFTAGTIKCNQDGVCNQETEIGAPELATVPLYFYK